MTRTERNVSSAGCNRRTALNLNKLDICGTLISAPDLQSRPKSAASPFEILEFPTSQACISSSRPSSAAVRVIKANMATKSKYQSKKQIAFIPKDDKPFELADLDNEASQKLALNALSIDQPNQKLSKQISNSHKPLVGAHTAGYYFSKVINQKGRNIKLSSPNISELIKLKPQTTEPLRNPEPPKLSQATISSARPSEKGRPSRSASRKNSSVILPDYQRIELHLSTLTDKDGIYKEILEAVSHLCNMTATISGILNDIILEPPVYEAFYESGMVALLVDMLTWNNLWPDVLAKVCILLNFVISNCSNYFDSSLAEAHEEFINLNAFSYYIKAGALCAQSKNNSKAFS